MFQVLSYNNSSYHCYSDVLEDCAVFHCSMMIVNTISYIIICFKVVHWAQTEGVDQRRSSPMTHTQH